MKQYRMTIEYFDGKTVTQEIDEYWPPQSAFIAIRIDGDYSYISAYGVKHVGFEKI
jgi:alpha-acetolactate decarboxylase